MISIMYSIAFFQKWRKQRFKKCVLFDFFIERTSAIRVCIDVNTNTMQISWIHFPGEYVNLDGFRLFALI